MAPPQGESSKPGGTRKKKSVKRNTIKVFMTRESYYTILMEDEYLESVYYLCLAIFFVICLDSMAFDFSMSGRVFLGTHTIAQGFTNFHIAILAWLFMHTPVITLYSALLIWGDVQDNLKCVPFLGKLWNAFSIVIFVLFQLCLLGIGMHTCNKYRLPFGSAIALLMETIRLMMKTYAFVRTSVPKFVSFKNFILAPLDTYLYFLVAPTLLYKDYYPRTPRIRWKFVMKNLAEMFIIIVLFSIIYERHILPKFFNLGFREATTVDLIERFFALIMPCFMMLLCIHYLILHCWMNVAAEVLRFGDRMFYVDWWISANYATFFRSWNLLVHEWLFEYVYKDLYKYVFKGSTVSCAMTVFYLSAILHEIVVGMSLRIFYPVLFLMFGGTGVFLYFTTEKLPTNFGKVFMWFSLLFGNTVIVYLYAMEYFARRNTFNYKSTDKGWLEKVTETPESWTLMGLTKA